MGSTIHNAVSGLAVYLQILRQGFFVAIQQFSILISSNILNLAFSSTWGSEFHNEDFLTRAEQKSYTIVSTYVA